MINKTKIIKNINKIQTKIAALEADKAQYITETDEAIANLKADVKQLNAVLNRIEKLEAEMVDLGLVSTKAKEAEPEEEGIPAIEEEEFGENAVYSPSEKYGY